MTEQRATGFDFEALRHAEEQHDLDAMLDLYADYTEIHIVNRNTRRARRTCCGTRRRYPST